MNTNDNTYLTICRLLDSLLADLTRIQPQEPENQNREYVERLVKSINDLNKLKAYY